MASRNVSASEKLKMFAVSPSSSQDFEVSDNQIDETLTSLDNTINSNSDKTSRQSLKYTKECSPKRRLINPITSTQYVSDVTFDKMSKPTTSGKQPTRYFKPCESPIKASVKEKAIDEAYFDLACSPSPKSSPTQLNPFADMHSVANNRGDIVPTGRPLYQGQPPTNNYGDIDNLRNENSLSGRCSVNISEDEDEPVINADQVIELASGLSPSNLSYSDCRSDNPTSKRQFPGPAGILPRLHVGLEGNPRLASLMRLHKGSDLRKFSGNEKKYNKSPTGNSTTENQTVERSEYIDNNELWARMLNDEKLATEGYHELMEKFNIQFIKKSSDVNHAGDSYNTETLSHHVGFIAKTPLLIAAVKWIDLATGHQDPTCQLIDTTGTIYGQLSSEIIEQYGARIQPGTVMVLRNMAILSTARNVYVNITLSNMVALFWLPPSSESGLCKTPGIFGKRICRVTKDDILRDAKLMEDEAQEEANAHHASLQSEMAPNTFPSASRNMMSPTSSTSSVPSSIRTPMNNMQDRIYNKNHQGNYIRNHIPPIRPSFRPHLSSSLAGFNKNSYPPVAPENNFRSPTTYWQPGASFNRDITSGNPPRPSNSEISMSSTKSTNPNNEIIGQSEQNNLNQLNYMRPNNKFNPINSSSPCLQKENMSAKRNSMGSIISDNSYNLLEGLDEDSLFGDF